MPRFRKRPHEVAAFQWKGWGRTPDIPDDILMREHNLHTELWVGRLYGWVRLSLGDWIISDRYNPSLYETCSRWQFVEDYEPLERLPTGPTPPSRPRSEGLI